MPTLLSKHRLKLAVRLNTLDAGFRRHLRVSDNLPRLDRYALREGLVSALWQCWGQFVRAILIESARGAFRDNGDLTVSPYQANSEAEIAFVCMKLAHRKSVGLVRAISSPHVEPTWGDVDKAILIASGIGITNSAEVLSALSIPSSLKDLQLCRNAAAHLGRSTFSELRAARVRYADTWLMHPTDAVVWVDNTTYGYLWDTWVDQIRLAADYACR